MGASPSQPDPNPVPVTTHVAVLIAGRATLAQKRLIPQVLKFLRQHPHCAVDVIASIGKDEYFHASHPRLRFFKRIQNALNHALDGHRDMLSALSNPANMLSMFFHLAMATTMAAANRYDCVLRYRADIVAPSLPADIATPHTDPQKVFVPLGNDFGGLNDRVAWGSQAAMAQFNNVHLCITDMMAADSFPCKIHPERMQAYCTAGLTIVRPVFLFSLDPARK